MSYAYLASPYSHPDAIMQESRFHAVSVAAGALMQRGEIVFSPICHCHPIAEVCNLRGDAGYWAEFNRTFLTGAAFLYVLQLPGWDASDGVAFEMGLARELKLSIKFLSKDFGR